MRSDAFSLLGEKQEYLDQGLVGLEEWYGKENGTACRSTISLRRYVYIFLF